MAPVFASALDASARDAWADRIGAGPDAYVVEEFLPLSHAPVWQNDRVESRAVMLRVFLIADGRGDYRMMPGGLCRIAGADPGIVSGQRGGSSKDTWVVAGTPSFAAQSPATVDRRARAHAGTARRTHHVQPSRREPVLAGEIR
jgi:uncharacterized circularly permuted ATP-grasp superfamily protein